MNFTEFSLNLVKFLTKNFDKYRKMLASIFLYFRWKWREN